MIRKKARRLIAPVLGIVVTLICPAEIFAEKSILDHVAQKAEIPAAQAEEDGQKQLPQVILPTNTENIFDFILDPQQLIEETGAVTYNGEKFEPGASLFFKRSDGGVEEDYSSSSDKITIINKGSAAVDVVLTAKMSSLDGIAMTEDPEFQDDTRPSLYLALTDGEQIVPLDSGDGVDIQASVPAADGENEYSFQLIGATNTKGDWAAIKAAKPKVTVTWRIICHGEAGEMGDEFGADRELPENGEPVENPQDISGIEPPVISPVESSAE
ncbi:MAG TPA: hypothetical protein DF613_10680 [Lachnospiraceae bacterium]|nr:hypothetical protein [Lachnospiraceae bacterium]